MKRYKYILLSIPFFSFIQTEKEIPSKIYYKDEKYVNIIWNFNIYNEMYPDTEIFINRNIDIFNFKNDTKNISIYFDKQFKRLAVLIELEKKDKMLHYKRFDQKGDLRMEYIQKNNEYEKYHKAWYSNGKLRFKNYYEKGQHISDTLYYITGEIERSVFYFYSSPFNIKDYYKNGKVASEVFSRIPKKGNALTLDYSENAPKLEIDYDSITGFPNLYYLYIDRQVLSQNDGSEYIISSYKKIHVDSIEIKR